MKLPIDQATPLRKASFLYQFETLCRNRLRYDQGLAAIAEDPIYGETWREWIQIVRLQIGIVDFADMIYVRSAHYLHRRRASGAGEVDEHYYFLEKKRERSHWPIDGKTLSCCLPRCRGIWGIRRCLGSAQSTRRCS